MELPLRTLRFRLQAAGLLPTSRLARAACYLLGLDFLLFALQRFFALLNISYGQALSGWVGVLSFLAIVLFGLLAFRWLKAKVLWRLRNRLIVTYIFIGVIPVVLVMAMASITIYLFAGQFANFIVTSELDSRLRSLQSVNAAIANELAARLERGQPATAESLEGLKRRDSAWASRRQTSGGMQRRHTGRDSVCAANFLASGIGREIWSDCARSGQALSARSNRNRR
jgi:nitrogen fixation/metabolism regulation signal transduction histidine kinase